jgi:hypothetical protein
MDKRIEILWNRNMTLTPVDESRLEVGLVSGTNLVIIIEVKDFFDEKIPDQGLVQELCLEFRIPPVVGKTTGADQMLQKALFQAGGISLEYQSTRCRGWITVHEWQPGAKISGEIDLHFFEPVFDRFNAGIVSARLDF